MGELAYNAVREAILSGKLEPGTRLNQDELARCLGVSRAPVRDALNRLEAEALIRTVSRKGLVVADMTPTDLRHIFELRGLLDSHSAQLAAGAITEDGLDRLQQIVKETEGYAATGEADQLVRVHAEFHYAIYAACGNPELERVARNLWDRSYRFRVMGLRDPELSARSLAAHRDVLQALRDHDAERAARKMGEEIQLIIEHLLPLLATRGRQGGTPDTGEGFAARRGRPLSGLSDDRWHGHRSRDEPDADR